MATDTTNTGRQKLDGTSAPALPFTPVAYDRQSEDSMRNILRQYHRQIDNFTSSLIDAQGGRYLSFPRGAFYDTESQSDGVNTPNAVQFNQTVTQDTSGFSVANNLSGKPTRVTAEHQGDYNFQFSLQFQNADNAQHNVGIWVRIDGVDIPNTTTEVTVPARKTASIYGYAVAAWNFVLNMQAGQYLELMWASPSSLVTIPYLPEWSTATGTNTPTKIYSQVYNRPATPSSIMTVTFVSRL